MLGGKDVELRFRSGVQVAKDHGEMELTIGSRVIGDGHPALLVAELSANHGKSLELALETVDAAAEAGADAIKLQTYTPDGMTLNSDKPEFRISSGSLWDGRTLYDLYSDAYTPWEWHREIFERAQGWDMEFFSTPFDAAAISFLMELRVSMMKVASFEITDPHFIFEVASAGLPIAISTGIATESEITEAVGACHQSGNDQIILTQCSSVYPAKVSDANLRTMVDYRAKYGCLVGYSDHTLGEASTLAAIALGAALIEKHFILDKNLDSPDAPFSMDPNEFKAMASNVRSTEEALGSVTYTLTAEEEANRAFARSLFVVVDVAAGEFLSQTNVRSIRPGQGLAPSRLHQLLGRRFAVDVAAGTPLSDHMVCPPSDTYEPLA